jgi:hypothetical protein
MKAEQQTAVISINTNDELNNLAEEFSDSIKLVGGTERTSMNSIIAARRLVQKSTDSYSIVIPPASRSIWSGDGSGEWVAALVFVPNHEIEDFLDN